MKQPGPQNENQNATSNLQDAMPSEQLMGLFEKRFLDVIRASDSGRADESLQMLEEIERQHLASDEDHWLERSCAKRALSYMLTRAR